MENFFKRLKLYGIGFGIGLFCVFVFFKNRGCSWLPENKVKESILQRIIYIHTEDSLNFTKMKLGSSEVKKMIDNGSVVFSESKKKGDPRAYVMSCVTPKGKKINWIFTLPDGSFVSELKINSNEIIPSINKVRNSINGKGIPIYFPKNDELFYFGEKENLKKQLKNLGFLKSKDLQTKLEKNSYINFEKTKFDGQNSTHFLENENFEIEATWYKEKITIKRLSEKK